MSPPPAINFDKALPQIPATAPVKKHVVFSNSTLERAGDDGLGKSPSPMKFRAGSEIPAGTIIYPTLQPSLRYPDLSQDDQHDWLSVGSPSRRLTFGGEVANQRRQFSFDSGKPVQFGKWNFSFTTGTIVVA